MLRGMQMQQMQMQQKNMLAQEQERQALAAERRRATEAQNALAAYSQSGQPMTPEALARFGAPGLALAKNLREEHTARIEQEIKVLDYASRRLAGATKETYAAVRADLNRISPQFGAALPQEFNPEQVMALARQGMSLKDQIESATKETVVPPGATLMRGGKPLYTAPAAEKPYEPTEVEKLTNALKAAPPGSPEAQALQARIRILTTREPKEPKEPSAPIPVVDEATGKVKYVSREEAIGKTPPSAMEGLAPKEIQRREAVFPQAKQSVATVTNTMTEVENTIDRLLKNPKGLNGITGLVYGRTPALTDDARRAESDIKQLRNLAFVQGLTELRAASKTGAGVGNVSNKEGDRFENLKASLETTQSFDDMVAALKRLKAQTSATKTNLQTEFEDMYSYRQGRQSAPAPAPAPAPGAPTPAGFPAPPQGAIDALKRGQGTDAQFDAIFGPGAAARARRQ